MSKISEGLEEGRAVEFPYFLVYNDKSYMLMWSLLVDFTVLESFSDKNCELKLRDEQGKFKIEKGPFMAIF